MIKIGVVNIDTSNPKAFAQILQKTDRARYYALYNEGFRKMDEVQGFMESAEIHTLCDTPQELAQITDIGFIQGCNWDKHVQYAKAFVDAGKPVYIDKPIVGNMADCHTLKAWADDGAVIFGGSSSRYAQEVCEYLQTNEHQRGRIVNVFGTAGVDEFNYGIHIVEAICALMGQGAQWVRFCGSGRVRNYLCETFMIGYENGTSAMYNNFTGLWMPFMVNVMSTKGNVSFRIDSSTMYVSLLDRLINYMETGRSEMAGIDEMIESVKIMLAGKLSKEKDGHIVYLSDIPDDYKGYDGYEFEKAYALQARKIYV